MARRTVTINADRLRESAGESSLTRLANRAVRLVAAREEASQVREEEIIMIYFHDVV